MTEAGPPAPRASDDDREHAVVVLREASVDGRLTLDELAARTERAQLALTRPELAELTADLAGTAAAAPPQPERNRVLFSAHARRGRWRPARAARSAPSTCAAGRATPATSRPRASSLRPERSYRRYK